MKERRKKGRKKEERRRRGEEAKGGGWDKEAGGGTTPVYHLETVYALRYYSLYLYAIDTSISLALSAILLGH